MIRVWMTYYIEVDGGWFCLATDIKGNEITHDRAVSPMAAIGAVVHTLTKLNGSVTIEHLEML